jgi:hypothetical protein
MQIGKLAGALVAAAMMSGAAWGQEAAKTAVTYEDALQAVQIGGCDRQETNAYVVYRCIDQGANVFFTRPGQRAHPAYLALEAFRPDLHKVCKPGVSCSTPSGFTGPSAPNADSLATTMWLYLAQRDNEERYMSYRPRPDSGGLLYWLGK